MRIVYKRKNWYLLVDGNKVAKFYTAPTAAFVDRMAANAAIASLRYRLDVNARCRAKGKPLQYPDSALRQSSDEI